MANRAPIAAAASSMTMPWASIVHKSAQTLPARMAARGTGLASSLSIIPVSMSVIVAMPDCSAVNSIDSTSMLGVKKVR